MTPETALQDAIVARLLADGPLQELVGEKIFDEVPGDRQAASPPYVEVGTLSSLREEMGGGPGWAVVVRLYAYSTAFGRKKAWEIAGAMRAALDGAELELAEPYRASLPLEALRAGDVVDPPSPKSVFVDVGTTVSASSA